VQLDTTEVEITCLTYAERKKKISPDRRAAFSEEVKAFHREGLGQRAIARQLHISSNTVQRYVSSPGFPERAEGSGLRPKGKTKLDPYLPDLREQWAAGIHNNAHLFAEIRERGYTGCQSGLRKLLPEWRRELPPKRRQGSPRKPRLFAAFGAAASILAWSLVSDAAATGETDS
jgi:hypothetical protein